jgi:hypothetical protein
MAIAEIRSAVLNYDIEGAAELVNAELKAQIDISLFLSARIYCADG